MARRSTRRGVSRGRSHRAGPLATRFAKESIARGSELPLAEALRLELELTVLLQTTADRAEGVAAFVEGREPRFVGR